MKAVPDVETALAEVKGLQEKGVGLLVRLPFLDAWTVLMLLQLALRHPGLDAAIVERGEKAARKLQGLLSVTPALAGVAQSGWDPEFDVETVDSAEECQAIVADVAGDLAREMAEKIAARHVVVYPLLTGTLVRRVVVLLNPPVTDGIAAFTGDAGSAEHVAGRLRQAFAAAVLEGMRALKKQ